MLLCIFTSALHPLHMLCCGSYSAWLPRLPCFLITPGCRKTGEPELSAQGTLGTQAARRLRLPVALANVREPESGLGKPLSLC